ncbi:Acetyltransferase (GNAT) family protein [Duganella sp. CF458]|uniref:GNAT family N-acetyltransferase n=1 Tax=Duganella sp. CF458 TaxID=1884368 RepID=UPI0008E66841|nr:GNAT family N-acetyltransferase [Duganella sp. CF458]SFG27384.1 Acetyltransferase (GNAT) family protein [Duganella sp. CF458]
MRTIEELDGAGLLAHADQLADVLHACVLAGASVGFELPCPREEARAFWLGLQGALARGERRLFIVRGAAGQVDGTLQLVLAGMPNGRHRAELSKMLVHPRARRQGLAQALVRHAEATARMLGRTLIVLDTCSGEPAEGMYLKLGYARCGEIPQFATMPDGRPGATTFMYKLLPCVAAADPCEPDAVALMAELDAALQAITGDSGRSGFSAEDTHGEAGRFAVARDAQGKALGCGALRPVGDSVAEIKRMYARPGSKGIGSAVLAWLEGEARRIGYRALRLETRLANRRAVQFYLAHGYRRTDNFGRYAGNPAAACFEKTL